MLIKDMEKIKVIGWMGFEKKKMLAAIIGINMKLRRKKDDSFFKILSF